jgi:hypothetical protein
MLFDPLEEQLHLPALFIDICNSCGSNFKVVGEENGLASVHGCPPEVSGRYHSKAGRSDFKSKKEQLRQRTNIFSKLQTYIQN